METLTLKQQDKLMDELESLNRRKSYVKFQMSAATNKKEWEDKLAAIDKRNAEICETLWPEKYAKFNHVMARVMESIQKPVMA